MAQSENQGETAKLNDPFDPTKTETVVLSLSKIRRAIKPGPLHTRSSLGENQREVILVIRGVVERVLLAENQPIVMGRTDLSTRFHPEIDLSAYGAAERGVSRSHASLHVEGRKLYVTDLGSTNGTFLRGKRLSPHRAQTIYKGDDLILGRLPVQIMFE
jgi:pSer/pThr/pTyr-binding forkhead associated (FHA) protein